MLGAKKRDRRRRRERILVVEDDVRGAKMIEMALHDVGIRDIVMAKDGMEAWGQLKAGGDQEFDAVISDWNMPFVTGIELLEQVRDSGIKIPFIIITGRGSTDAAVEAKEFGVTAFMIKPYSPKQLGQKVLEFVCRGNL